MTALPRGGPLALRRAAPPGRGTRPDWSPGHTRTVGSPAFLGVAVASLGGPLALAALYAPTILTDASASSGLVAAAAAVVFAAPLVVWAQYSRHVASSGGLYAFVRDAAGPRLAAIQAALWLGSYGLYLAYTTASVVYDTLPAVTPAVRPYQRLVEVAIPAALAAVMLAGRTVTLAVIGALAAGQLVLVGVLAVVAVGHAAPAASFAPAAVSGTGVSATGQVALLYVCGSLPVFLGGEVRRPRRTVPRGLIVAYALVAAGVVAAVFPLAADPAFTRAPIPGMSLVEVFAGHPAALAVGFGVAASVVGVMLVEFLAVTRLLHALTRRPGRTVTRAVAGALVVTAPLTLIDPERVYSLLLKPSLIALWLSQLVVFLVYPRFAVRHGMSRPAALALAAVAVVLTVYGLDATLRHATT